MNNHSLLQCPHCGSRRFYAQQSSRKVFIHQNGTRIPLLTEHFRLALPVIEELATIYNCTCSWSSCDK